MTIDGGARRRFTAHWRDSLREILEILTEGGAPPLFCPALQLSARGGAYSECWKQDNADPKCLGQRVRIRTIRQEMMLTHDTRREAVCIPTQTLRIEVWNVLRASCNR